MMSTKRTSGADDWHRPISGVSFDVAGVLSRRDSPGTSRSLGAGGIGAVFGGDQPLRWGDISCGGGMEFGECLLRYIYIYTCLCVNMYIIYLC